eukprot:scaffold112050_cov36-Tisochrysis_lutea.AAC.1
MVPMYPTVWHRSSRRRVTEGDGCSAATGGAVANAAEGKFCVRAKGEKSSEMGETKGENRDHLDPTRAISEPARSPSA